MKIKTVERFIFKDIEYKSLKEVQDKIHNTIGEELFDKMERICPLEKRRDYFKLLDIICDPDMRRILIECLTTTFVEVSPDIDSSGIYQGDVNTEINILDIKF